MMSPCMVCGKTGVRLFRVEKNYGTVNRTVRDDMVEIFGEQVISYLYEDDYVCNMCMNMLDNFAKLKRRLWPLIIKPREDRKPIKLGRIWNMFASLKIEEDELDAEIPEANLTPSQTPSSLLTLNYSVPYSSKTEARIERREYCKSRSSSIYSRSDVSESSELHNMFRRRRRRGHGWARRKGRSTYSNVSYDSLDSLSEYSFYSYRSNLSGSSSGRTPSKRKGADSDKHGVEYDSQGRLVQKRTRSVSRAQEEEKKILERLEESKLYCNEKDCPFYFEDLDVVNYHRINDHDIRPLFVCNECDNRYTTRHHLQLHLRQHDFLPFFCLMCEDELPNTVELQKHLDQHVLYSVPCKFCDKSFLSRGLTERHTKRVHRDKRNRRIFRDKLILARIDKNENNENSGKSEVEEDSYRIYFSLYTDMVREISDMDMTEDNLKKMNIPFYSGEDYADINSDEENLNENEGLSFSEDITINLDKSVNTVSADENITSDKNSVDNVNDINDSIDNLNEDIDNTSENTDTENADSNAGNVCENVDNSSDNVDNISDQVDDVGDILDILSENVTIDASIDHDSDSIDFEVPVNSVNNQNDNLSVIEDENLVNTENVQSDCILNSSGSNLNVLKFVRDNAKNLNDG